MVSTLLLCSGMMAAVLGETDRMAYEAARVQAGRDANAHVKLALWCEQHGLTAERAKHLALAVLNDPRNAMARGLMGLVLDQGAWRRPEDVSAKLKADAERAATRAEYNDKRTRAPHTADGQWKLALWCEQNGLNAEATAHFTAVIKLDPTREAAWKRLGFRKQGKRWVSDAQLAAEKEERALQEKADRHWKPLLEKWRSWLNENGKHRGEAERALSGITDARAVPMLIAVFGTGAAERQAVAVRLLGQIDAPGASRALALLGVFGKSPEVRRVATETLRRRDVREFADLLIALVRDPINYEVRPVNGPGSQGELFVHGKQVDYKRLYSPPNPSALPPGGRLSYDASGLPVMIYTAAIGQTAPVNALQFLTNQSAPAPISPALRHTITGVLQNLGAGANSQGMANLMLSSAAASMTTWNNYAIYGPIYNSLAFSGGPLTPHSSLSFTIGAQAQVPIGQMVIEAQKSALGAEQQLESDVRALDALNAEIRASNERVLPILTLISGQDFGSDRDTWETWFLDQVGFRKIPQKASESTIVVEQVPLEYQPGPIPISQTVGVVGFKRMSCFGKGTIVATIAGTQSIETLLPGDVVLAQNIDSGALSYQPILAVHHNPPGKTFRVAVGNETIVSSEFHRFWKAGHGWVMARDLKPGDALRTLGGVESVSSIEPGKVEPVYNLDVAQDADFFVGQRGALVHDNTLPDLRIAPFDAGVLSAK